jgi:hypothetical protein
MFTASPPSAEERNKTGGREMESSATLTESQLRDKRGTIETERRRNRYRYARMPYSESCDMIIKLKLCLIPVCVLCYTDLL